MSSSPAPPGGRTQERETLRLGRQNTVLPASARGDLVSNASFPETQARCGHVQLPYIHICSAAGPGRAASGFGKPAPHAATPRGRHAAKNAAKNGVDIDGGGCVYLRAVGEPSEIISAESASPPENCALKEPLDAFGPTPTRSALDAAISVCGPISFFGLRSAAPAGIAGRRPAGLRRSALPKCR